MPYIKQSNRFKFDDILEHLSEHRNITAGELNYLISSLVWAIFKDNRSYSKANELMGVLECVRQEFYRRQVAEYEDECIEKNGDLEL